MAPLNASRYTGYAMGGTSPFGTRQSLPVYAEETIFGLDEIFINGGKRGLLLKMLSADLYKVLSPTLVKVMI